MATIYVWFRDANGSVMRAGELRFAEEAGPKGTRLVSEFRYDEAYLENNFAIALNPASMPLETKPFSSSTESGLHGVFEDSLPDAWGRRLLCKKLKLPLSLDIWPQLLLHLNTNCLGALAYTENKRWRKTAERRSILELDDLVNAAQSFENDPNGIKESFAALLQAGSSPGGARPKAIIIDEAGIEWIAKFPSIHDQYDICGLEATAMQLCKDCDINTAEFKII